MTVNFIAIGKRAGYENPQLPKEVIHSGYITSLSRGLHNDADTITDREGRYYENGQLVVGEHPSTLPEANKKTRQLTEKPVNNDYNGIPEAVRNK